MSALNINVVGTFAVTKAFLPLLKRGEKKTIMNITSDAACLSLMASQLKVKEPIDAGLGLSYKASKAALNMRKPCCLLPCFGTCMTCLFLSHDMSYLTMTKHIVQPCISSLLGCMACCLGKLPAD